MNAEKLSITLPADMVRLIRQRVETGDYASNSEVIRDAMRGWIEAQETRAARLDSIRQRLDEALEDSSPRLSPAQVRAEMTALHAETTARPKRRA